MQWAFLSEPIYIARTRAVCPIADTQSSPVISAKAASTSSSASPAHPTPPPPPAAQDRLRGMFGTVPLAFSAARRFSGSALCPPAGDIEEPLAQFWVGDQLGAARTFARIFQAFCLGVHAGLLQR